MAALTGATIASTYTQLLRMTNATLHATTGYYIKDSADTNSALSIATTRVGIGTATPETTLHVKGTGGGADGDYSVAIPRVSLLLTGGTFTNSMQFGIASDEYGWIQCQGDDDGEEDLILQPAGANVGIGTTAPAAPLEVSSAIDTGSTVGADADCLAIFENTSAADNRAAMIKLKNSHADSDNYFVWDSKDDDDSFMYFFDADTNGGTPGARMTINSDGKVGIGTATPDYHLTISTLSTTGLGVKAWTGTTVENAGHIDLLRSRGTSESSYTVLQSGDRLGAINFYGADGDSWALGAAIRSHAEGTINDADCPAQLSFWTTPTGGSVANIAQRMTIGEDGNVGIGDDTPDAPLCINQAASDASIVTFKSSDVAHGMTDIIETDSYGRFLKVAGAYGGLKMDGFVETGEYSSVIIEGNGVDDDATRSTSARGNIELRSYKKSSATHGGMNADQNMVVISNGTTARYIFDVDGSAHADVEWVAFSDSRLKSSIETVPYGLAEVLQLQPKRFDKQSGCFDESGDVVLEDAKRKMIGFLAQDVKAIIPEVVKNIDENTSFYSMDDGKLMAVLVKAIQELSAKVTALENA